MARRRDPVMVYPCPNSSRAWFASGEGRASERERQVYGTIDPPVGREPRASGGVGRANRRLHLRGEIGFSVSIC